MPTSPDDLRPGQFIVVVHDKRMDDPAATSVPPPPWCRGYTGQPSEILAISLPFIAVTNGAVIDSIDVRDYDVQVVSKKYAMVMLQNVVARHDHLDGGATIHKPPINSPGIKQARRHARKIIVEAAEAVGLIHQPHPRDCPQCGERMVRRREYPKSSLTFKSLNASPHATWLMVCKRCGFQRPPEMAELK